MVVPFRRHRVVLNVLLVALVASIGPLRAHAQGADDLAALREQVSQLRNQAKYAEAAPVAERYVALARQKHGEEHEAYAAASSWLAIVYKDQGRYAEAEPLYLRVLTFYEKAAGPNHPHVAATLSNLAEVYLSQGRYVEAERMYKRALAIREKALGPEHQLTGDAIYGLAGVYRGQGRLAEAEQYFKRALEAREKGLGADHLNVGTVLSNIAEIYLQQGRNTEAEPLYKRALTIREKALGLDHPFLTGTLGGLALLYKAQGRFAEAEAICRRDLSIVEKALHPDHQYIGISLARLADLYYAQKRYSEALPLFERSLKILEKALAAEHPIVGTAVNNLASVYWALGRYSAVEPLFKRSLAMREKVLGPDHSDVGQSLNNIAKLYLSQGRYAEAELPMKRALAIYEKAFGSEHPTVGVSLGNLAEIQFGLQRWTGAADLWRRSTQVIIRRAKRGSELTGKGESEATLAKYRFWGLVKAVYRLAETDKPRAPEMAREMFQIVQWAQASEAAASLAQMAVRQTKGEETLARTVRERQDLVAEWQAKDKTLSVARSEPSARRNSQAETALSDRLAIIDGRIANIDLTLATDFPDYATLVSPEPLGFSDVQAQLGADEALVLFFDTPGWRPTPEETFIWVVTKTSMRWVRSGLGTPALTHEVAALRCGLDSAAWQDDGAAKCAALLSIAPGSVPPEAAQLPFDVARAHSLYKALFGQVEDLIRDKHLLIVPSGPLTQLPFQVLVAAAPTGGDLRATSWLARKHALTVLPAVSSLKALRRIAKASAAKKPLLGIGNPLLDGDPASRPWEAEWAKLALQKQACPRTPWERVAAVFERRRGVVPMATRSGRVDLDHLRSQSPLHDTADELCAVAKDLKLAPDDIVLGAKATEATIKKLSGDGRLADYRVVHFATHGTLSGEIEGTSEPGLILTPPKEQSEEDDGYLAASEVAALKLDADWVILSACNTAAGGSDKAEALSGLARAFFYGGARALLVSHWAVDSVATVKLVTYAVGATARDKRLGRAEALRRSMLAMIDTGEPREAHPAFWAPFVVVGEGAAAK
jgi:CHAT domain-containing protein/tetratricopeptide (TPR) repeat protein